MSGISHEDSLARMEEDGTMERRRAELRDWFRAHPHGTPLQAVQAFGYTFPDHMYVVADSVLVDLRRGTSTEERAS